MRHSVRRESTYEQKSGRNKITSFHLSVLGSIVSAGNVGISIYYTISRAEVLMAATL